MECVYSLIDYLTKFATVRMAITGEAFLEAARRATDLLARNFLKASLPCPHHLPHPCTPPMAAVTFLVACHSFVRSFVWSQRSWGQP